MSPKPILITSGFGKPERGREVADKLESANIIVDTTVRIGICEVTCAE